MNTITCYSNFPLPFTLVILFSTSSEYFIINHLRLLSLWRELGVVAAQLSHDSHGKISILLIIERWNEWFTVITDSIFAKVMDKWLEQASQWHDWSHWWPSGYNRHLCDMIEVTDGQVVDQASQWHEMCSLDLDVMSLNPVRVRLLGCMSLNPGWIKLGVRSASVQVTLDPKIWNPSILGIIWG